jgi:4-alpha-glucanotransferase
LFWIPEGHSAKDGTYVHEPWRDLLGILALESHRLRFQVIGEDLGTVSDEIRQGLNEYGVLSYKVLYFMRGQEGTFLPAKEYSVQAVATVTTHDLPTIAGFWESRDIEARWQAGLLSEETRRKQLDERAVDKQKLLELLHREKLVRSSFPSVANQIPAMLHELQDAILTMLASSPCSLLAINQEDLTLEVDQQNLPGSTAEYPNWRRKMKLGIEDLRHSQTGISLATKLRHWLEGSGRSRRKTA